MFIFKLKCWYSDQRLEEACKVALKQMNRPRYKDIKHILETGEDLCQPQESVPGKYTRGGDYLDSKNIEEITTRLREMRLPVMANQIVTMYESSERK